MKYNPRVSEALAARPELAELHPHQPDDTLQGVLEIVHGLDLILRELSGMDRFVFQAGGGAARRVHPRLRDPRLPRGARRARPARRGHHHDPGAPLQRGHRGGRRLQGRSRCMLEEDGYPSLEALRAAVSDRTAALMVNNPDDMGIYNPHIKEWVRIVHEAGGLCFYDHANFNGVMGKHPRARARLRRLHVHAAQDLRRAEGRRRPGRRRLRLHGGAGAASCRRRSSSATASASASTTTGPTSIGKVREFWGNVPQVVKAYPGRGRWAPTGSREAADLSVLANNYMEKRLLEIRGVTRSHPQLDVPRMEMTRYSLGELQRETGDRRLDVAEPHGRLRRSTRSG